MYRRLWLVSLCHNMGLSGLIFPGKHNHPFLPFPNHVLWFSWQTRVPPPSTQSRADFPIFRCQRDQVVPNILALSETAPRPNPADQVLSCWDFEDFEAQKAQLELIHEGCGVAGPSGQAAPAPVIFVACSASPLELPHSLASFCLLQWFCELSESF